VGSHLSQDGNVKVKDKFEARSPEQADAAQEALSIREG